MGEVQRLLDAVKLEIGITRQQDRYRVCRTWEKRDARTMVIGGRRMLNVSSNDYLGLAGDPRILRAAQNALAQFGWGAGASRLVTGQSAGYDELEAAIAEHKQAESALVFTSGYHANLGLVSTLVGADDLVVSDELNHASIWDACRLSRAKVGVYRHADPDDLARVLDRPGRYARRLVVTDSVFSMDGDVAPLPALLAVCERYGAVLLVDDAHGYGVLGPLGTGAVSAVGIRTDQVICMGTLSKAAASLGGYFAGPAVLRDALVQRARTLIYTTALPPAALAAAAAAVRLFPALEPQRAALAARAMRLRQGLQALGFDTGRSTTQIVPILCGSEQAALHLMNRFQEQGILAVAIRPPTVPQGSARLRVSLSAAHTDEDVEHILSAVRAA